MTNIIDITRTVSDETMAKYAVLEVPRYETTTREASADAMLTYLKAEQSAWSATLAAALDLAAHFTAWRDSQADGKPRGMRPFLTWVGKAYDVKDGRGHAVSFSQLQRSCVIRDQYVSDPRVIVAYLESVDSPSLKGCASFVAGYATPAKVKPTAAVKPTAERAMTFAETLATAEDVRAALLVLQARLAQLSAKAVA